jgi:RNA polymerase sigma factor (sigma-70 family)
MVSQIKAREPQADGPGGYADESALVAGLRAGRPEAYEALHAAYATSIYNLALRIVDDPHEAQDVTQEVVIKVLKGLPRDDGEFTLPAWLYRVTANAAFDHLRARKRRPVTVAADVAPEAASEVDEYERAELSRRVESTLRELPKRQQVALVLRDVHGLSVGETASVLGVTKGSADVLLSRARSGFRKVFLAGSSAGGRCAEAERILAGSVGGGVSAADRALLAEHTRSCPDCGRTVALWGAAPVGLGLLLPQVALPAKLSFGATLAAAQAAGVALPAGLGAAAAAGASAAGAAGSAAAASTAAATSAAVPAATAAGGAGVLAALGSAAGVKIATLAAVATAAVGIAGVATHERAQQAASDVTPAALGQDSGAAGGGSGVAAGDHGHARLLANARHRDGAGGEAHGGAGGRAAGESRHEGQRAGSGDGSGGRSGGHAGGGATGSAGGGAGDSAHDGSGSGDAGSHSGGAGAGSSGPSSGTTGGAGSGGDGGGMDSHTGAGSDADTGSGAGTGAGGDSADSGSHSGGD